VSEIKEKGKQEEKTLGGKKKGQESGECTGRQVSQDACGGALEVLSPIHKGGKERCSRTGRGKTQESWGVIETWGKFARDVGGSRRKPDKGC